ncbi:protein FAR1-RELATED SEQUENCE 7 isoform X1 [Prunus yedoensis var. nudiflora]|uniref:Protein FAR1-RELATED SEQUENCE 7 isoform X1 n=1 Tax=Prunus yedoensis var. nudiflora TaxID=2094558 RepID=A0A314U9D5_PRUYE|nr:protein FAR1-RELATED SEQUENCE 7 isoform X1 [Prunus yedoensis var. nudiflora]
MGMESSSTHFTIMRSSDTDSKIEDSGNNLVLKAYPMLPLKTVNAEDEGESRMLHVTFTVSMQPGWDLEFELVSCIGQEQMVQFLLGDLCAPRRDFRLVHEPVARIDKGAKTRFREVGCRPFPEGPQSWSWIHRGKPFSDFAEEDSNMYKLRC